MIWRIYPIAILIGLTIGTLVQLLCLVPGAIVLVLTAPLPPSGELASEVLQETSAHVLVLASLVAAYLAAGYTTARFAAGEELLNAAATGVVVMALGLAAEIGKTPWDVLPAWVDWLSLAIAVPLTLAGGMLFRRRAFAG